MGLNLGWVIQSKNLTLGVLRVQGVIKAIRVGKISEGEYAEGEKKRVKENNLKA